MYTVLCSPNWLLSLHSQLGPVLVHTQSLHACGAVTLLHVGCAQVQGSHAG